MLFPFETTQRSDNKLSQLSAVAKRLLYTPLFITLYAALIFFCWFFGGEEVGIILTVIIAGFILCAQADTLPLFTILFMVAFTFPDDIDPLNYLPIMPYLSIVAVGIICHFVRFRPRPRYTAMFFPMLAVSVALLMGGADSISAEHYAGGITYALLLGVAILALYVILGMYYDPPKDVDVKGYIMALLVTMGVVLALQTIVFYIRTDKPITLWTKINLDVGWGISNNVSTLLLMSFPACFYFASKTRYTSVIHMAIGIVLFIANVFTFSRGGILASLVVIVPTVIVGGIYAKNRKVYIISAAALFAVVAIILASTYKFWVPLIESTFASGMNSSGRDKLYAEALQGLIDHPIFGLGIGFRGDWYNIPNMPMYWFHSTFFQIIGSMGLLGLIAYVYFYTSRYYLILKRDMFNVFIFLCLLGFEGYSMIDTGTFVPIPTMLIAMMLTLAVERENTIDYPPYAMTPRFKLALFKATMTGIWQDVKGKFAKR